MGGLYTEKAINDRKPNLESYCLKKLKLACNDNLGIICYVATLQDINGDLNVYMYSIYEQTPYCAGL